MNECFFPGQSKLMMIIADLCSCLTITYSIFHFFLFCFCFLTPFHSIHSCSFIYLLHTTKFCLFIVMMMMMTIFFSCSPTEQYIYINIKKEMEWKKMKNKKLQQQQRLAVLFFFLAFGSENYYYLQILLSLLCDSKDKKKKAGFFFSSHFDRFPPPIFSIPLSISFASSSST